VWPQGIGVLIKTIYLIGLEPATLRLVAECFNHYATAWPPMELEQFFSKLLGRSDGRWARKIFKVCKSYGVMALLL
jgi:hypothetical protein